MSRTSFRVNPHRTDKSIYQTVDLFLAFTLVNVLIVLVVYNCTLHFLKSWCGTSIAFAFLVILEKYQGLQKGLPLTLHDFG